MIKFDEEILQLCPDLRLAILTADVEVVPKTELLWDKIEQTVASLEIQLEDIKSNPQIEAARAAYKAFGKDPSRYRLSAEALLRRVASGKGIYQISNLVDIVNLLSFKSGFSIGSYDKPLIQGDVLLRLGNENEPYETIGRGQINIHRLPMLCDQEGPFGNPSSDSKRTSISVSTKEILFVFFDFSGNGPIDEILDEATLLLTEFAKATNVKDYLLISNS